MDGEKPKSNTKRCTPFNFCAQLCLLTAAACGAQCGACEPDVTYYTKDSEVVRKRRKAKRVEIDNANQQQQFSFQLHHQRRTNKHKGQLKQWNTDSGATISVTNKTSIFKTVDEFYPDIEVRVANGQLIKPTMRGSVELNMEDK